MLSLAYVSGAQAQNSQPIKIGTNCTFDGQSGEMGVSMRSALRIAVAEINVVGGVGGRKIELVERDDQANPKIGALQQFHPSVSVVVNAKRCPKQSLGTFVQGAV